MITSLGILYNYHAHTWVHVQAVITRVWYSELSGLELLESYPWRWRRMEWDIRVWRLGTITLVLQLDEITA